MLSCHGCGAAAFTVGGLCAACDPLRHLDHREMMAGYDAAAAQFTAETGREPLQAWEEFEAWMDRQADAR